MTIAIDASSKVSTFEDRLSGASRANVIDRWIYVFTALVLIATVFAGFIPDSVAKVAAVEAGKRSPFPPILHAHAVLMGSFLLLLLAQTALVALGKRKWHMQLGMAGMMAAAAIVVTGVFLAHTMYRPTRGLDDILLVQIRAGILFSAFMWFAWRSRTRDSGLHKRLVILSITAVLSAAISRIHWLPTTLPKTPISWDFFTLLPYVPMFIWDVARNRSLHPAYAIWAVLFIPMTAVMYVVWDTPWWHATAHRIMGV